MCLIQTPKLSSPIRVPPHKTYHWMGFLNATHATRSDRTVLKAVIVKCADYALEKEAEMAELQLMINSGAWGRDEALKALRSKYAAWIDNVGAPILYDVCKRRGLFTTDEVWAAFGAYPPPGERRVMGALIRGFALRGLIVKTGISEKSEMPECHARDKALWRSNLYAATHGGTTIPLRCESADNDYRVE